MRAFAFGLGLLLFAVCHAFPYDSDSEEHGQYKGPVGTNCSCGWTNKARRRIVNGKEAYVNEYPWLVGLGSVNYRGNLNVFCGASIITPRHVLTAAHCTADDLASSLAVVTGEHDLTTAGETPFTKVYRILRKVEHPRYDPKTFENDIALLATVTEIEFNEATGPACLPGVPVRLTTNDEVRVAGWGDLAFNGEAATKVNKVTLRVADLYACSSKYPRNPIDTLRPKQFCTYTYNKDSCQGDSGGPVFWHDRDTNRYTLLGVVSFGMGCATPGYPGVNTDVYAYMDWIQNSMKDLHYSTYRTCAKN